MSPILVEIYSRPNCPSCIKAKNFFCDKTTYHVVNHDISSSNLLREEMFKRFPEAKTVPQIFIEGRHIGGWDDVVKIVDSGMLKELLNQKEQKLI